MSGNYLFCRGIKDGVDVFVGRGSDDMQITMLVIKLRNEGLYYGFVKTIYFRIYYIQLCLM